MQLDFRACLPAAVFAAAVALAALGALLGAPELVRAVLAAPVYYGLPLGVGLLLTWPLESALTRTQHALLAYLCGLVLICAVMVAREHAVPAQLNVDWLSFLILLAAIVGFGVGRRLFTWNTAAKSAVGDYLIVLPVFAMEYAARFWVFSEFPVTDLFQAIHVMKGALEFGRFDVLNPFAAGSYMPVIQALEGLLVRYLGYDPLYGAWILPAFATLPKFLACRAVFQVLLRERAARLFATAAAACFFSAITPTNGELTLLGSLLVLSFGATAAADGRLASALRVAALGACGVFLGYFAARSVPLLYMTALGAACVLPYVAGRLGLARAPLALPVLCVVLAPLHRSALAFVPMALALGALLPLATAWARAGGEARARRLALGTAGFTVLSACAIAALLAWILLNPNDDLRETGPGGWLVENILGATPTKANILAGSGPKVALFELARAVLPSLALFSGLLVALGAAARRPSPQALVAWGLAVALGSALLLGVPFVYRSAFLVVTLLILALAAAWQAFEQDAAARPRRVLLAMAGGYALAALPLVYRCGAIARCERADYLDMARPFLLVIGLLVLASAAAAALAARRASFRYLAPAALVLLFVLENGVSRSFFMSYGYGAPDPAARAVSHFGRADVELAAAVRAMGARVLIVSDPYTMSNLRALTGLNSLVTYSNLDTLSKASETRLREWLRGVLERPGTPGRCAPGHPLDVVDYTVNASEFNYWLARSSSPEVPGALVLRDFGMRNTLLLTPHPSRKGVPDRFPDAEWRRPALDKLEARFPGEAAILLVVDRKTVRWVRGAEDIGYFPDVRPLERELVERLERDCGARVHAGRFALIRFPMAGR